MALQRLGDKLVTTKQDSPDAVKRLQHDKNLETCSLTDFGGSRESFDPESKEDTKAREFAHAKRRPLLTGIMKMFPRMGLKVYNWLDSTYERGAVMMVRNMMRPWDVEPRAQIAGLPDSAALSTYGNRDGVGLYVQQMGQPALHKSAATTFTATTVTVGDLNDNVRAYLKRRQIIDVYSAGDRTKVYTAYIEGFSGSTISISDGWYLKDVKPATKGVPPDGSEIRIVPVTKIWAANLISMLTDESDANSMVGVELETRNNKAIAANNGYNLDLLNTGKYYVGTGCQVRGKYRTGYINMAGADYGFRNNPESGHRSIQGFSDERSQHGLHVTKNDYGVTVKDPTFHALYVMDKNNKMKTSLDASGSWQNFKLFSDVVNAGGNIPERTSVALCIPTESTKNVILPSASSSSRKTMFVKNGSTKYNLVVTGVFEGGKNGKILPPMGALTVFSDGNTWYILSSYLEPIEAGKAE